MVELPTCEASTALDRVLGTTLLGTEAGSVLAIDLMVFTSESMSLAFDVTTYAAAYN